MTEIILDMDTLNNLRAFEKITRTKAIDCINSETRITFIVPPRQLSHAIGRNAANVRRLREIMKKQVDIIEFSDDPEEFIRNIFHRFRVLRIEIKNGEHGLTAYVYVRPLDKGKAIGKNGSNLRRAENILKRHFGIENIYIQ